MLAVLLLLPGCLVIVDDDVDFSFDDAFDDEEWRLVILVDGDRTYTIRRGVYSLEFESHDELSGTADCNAYGATYRLHRGRAITITDVYATEIACGPGTLEPLFFDNLLRVASYRERDGDLLFYDASGDLLLHFEEE